MSSLIKGASPLDGAAAVRELTSTKTCETGQPVIDGPAVPWHRDQAVVVRTEPRINPSAFAQGVRIATEVCAAMTADVEHDGDRGPRAPKASKPFPMPGTVWRWLGHPDYDPKPSAPKRVESLRWFRGRVEAMFVGGESCAGVEHLMGSDAWEHYPETVPVGRDPLSVLDQAADAARAQAVQRLMSAVGALSVDEVAALAWVAWQLPGRKLRRKCEEATATGWCGSDVTKDPPAGRRTAEDGTRAALLAAWRQVVALVHGATSSASEDLRQRTRDAVLADEAARRAGGGE